MARTKMQRDSKYYILTMAVQVRYFEILKRKISRKKCAINYFSQKKNIYIYKLPY